MKNVVKFLKKYWLLFIVLVLLFGALNIFSHTTFSEKTTSTIWDGSIATGFDSGSGLENDPYVIKDGSELAYFFELLNKDENNDYLDKYYLLTNNINLDGQELPKLSKTFSGTFDGNGYALLNIYISNPYVIENDRYYSLFYNLNGANIKNLNIYDTKINSIVLKKEKNEIADPGKDVINNNIEENDTESDIPIEESIIENSELNEITEEKIEGAESSQGENITIEPLIENNEVSENDQVSYNNYIGIFGNVKNSTLTNINITNESIKGTKSEIDTYKTSLFVVNNDVGNSYANINIFGNSVYEQTKIFTEDIKNSSLNRIIYYDNGDHFTESNLSSETIVYKYNIINNTIVFENNVDSNDIINLLNENSNYDWIIDDASFRIQTKKVLLFEPKALVVPSPKKALSSAPAANNSGVNGTTVYVNDYEMDRNYYQGLNYTNSTNNAYPTLVNKKIYDDTNLVYVQATYYGSDYENNYEGELSPTEAYNKFVYYKVYPINNNGTASTADDFVEFELIDHPWTKRPNNQAFNGWVTDMPGATITLDMDKYVRKVRVPITYQGSNPKNIVIDFYSTWIDATTYTVTANTQWSTILAGLEAEGMHQITTSVDMSILWERSTIARYSYYPIYSYRPTSNGATTYRKVTNTTTQCNTNGGCPYYYLTTDTIPTSGKTYYTKSNSTTYATFTQYTVPVLTYSIGKKAGGLFRGVAISNGTSQNGYYDASGKILSGNCTTRTGCTVYELINLVDSNGNFELITAGTNYYKLTTRDTNIVFLSYNGTMSRQLASTTQTKPFTFTSYNNGSDRRSNAIFNNTTAYANKDLRIEWMRINGGTGAQNDDTAASTTYMISAKGNNLKIGRGVIKSGNNQVFGGVYGANGGVGSSGSPAIYRVIVESGFYNTMASIAPNSGTYYAQGEVIYGSDFDRVTNNNSNLNIRFVASTLWAGTVYSYSSSNNTALASQVTVKSGTFGSNTYDYTAGMYALGRGSSGTTIYAPVSLTIEGGDVYNISGGPFADSSITETNIVYIYVKGGIVHAVFGGAGTTLTYGNRIIQLTGGLIEYSVCGGSNGVTATGDDGRVSGSTYVYAGGNVTVGDSTIVANNTNESDSKIEAGSIFGAGNGNNNVASAGSVYNSRVVIDDGAIIRRNVYGGGNYGATGSQNNNAHNPSTTDIVILGGSIAGSVYGGGNQNGSGSSTINSNIKISMSGGSVGNIYGGSNIKGTVYGGVNLSIDGGTVGNIYGGGEGGYTSNTAPGTYVRDNVAVIIGNSTSGPTISGNVYGGSAYGTVNATDRNGASSASKSTTVTVNNGNIQGSVFGGAKGSSTFTPHVKGVINVNINGGSTTYVYGGFDASGTPEQIVSVYLNGGTIGTAFGGGNNTSISDTNIYLRGSTVTDVYGGSNNSGNVSVTNVSVESGNATNVYGGNNQGGSCATTNISVTGGTVSTAIYGGGNAVETTTANVKLYNHSGTIESVYGGGNEAGATTTNVTTYTANPNNINITNIYGGSNKSGTINNSYVTINHGNISSVYGGNNRGGTTTASHVVINDGSITNIFGGGNQAVTSTSNVEINGGTLTNAYGGGNLATVTTSNINVKGGNTTNVFGGGNEAAVTTANVGLYNGTITNTYGGGNEAGVTNANIIAYNDTLNPNNINVSDVYGGSNQSGTVNTATIVINKGTYGNVYGGNNRGGTTNNSNVTFNDGTVTNIYGGGNLAVSVTSNVTFNGGSATEIYGGGNQAGITGSTNLYAYGGIVSGNIYGGGNEGSVGVNTNVYLNDAVINGSAYAGGNGSTATVNSNTNIYVGGNTVIGTSSCTSPSYCSVFGGGNAAFTGTSTNDNSLATVNIAGATIYGNVYGGANTSKVFGGTVVNIGSMVTPTAEITKDDILINGTVFGGGEANASGSDIYDYSFISVTRSIDVNIDALNYTNFNINGSIFGSGNASSTTGTSDISIKNYGTFKNPKRNISIQRTDKLTLDNSSIALSGATDRTNEYSQKLFTLSNVDEVELTNNSTLYLEENANLLKNFRSTDSNGNLEVVTINPDTGVVTKNVDNRLYLYEGQVLNIATTENNTSYGDVYGMTFFGMYKYDASDNVYLGIYDKHNYNDTLDWGGVFNDGSYVQGAHKINHDITVDGFYTNYINEETSLNKMDYIDPTPEDSPMYMWIIGEMVMEYNVDLTASKYSTLGTYELPFSDFSRANTSFVILGVDYSQLDPSINLINKNLIPRNADTAEDADTNFGISMEASNIGWLTTGSTSFYTSDPQISGVKTYVGENTTNIPSLLFYLYHSKNIASTGDLGTVKITIMAITKVDDLTNETERLIVNVNLSRVLYNTNDYEASLTAGRKYELFTSSLTNITSKSSVSAYYSLYAAENLYSPGYHRVLVSNYVLPLNTKITMIDLSGDDKKYYYHIINQSDVIQAQNQLNTMSEVNYDLSMFEVMGSFDGNTFYDDASMNSEYYHSSENYSLEEFIFIIDFADANITSSSLNNLLLLEMQDSNDQTRINVLGIQHSAMIYNLYADRDAVIDISGTISDNRIYSDETVTVDLLTNYTQSSVSGLTIYDTRYFDSKLGIEIELLNSDGEVVSGTSMLGLYYEIDGVRYYPNIDGTTRIKIADKVGNAETWIRLVTGTSQLATGNYTLRIQSFGSPDGIYYSLDTSDTLEFDIYIVNEIYGLNVHETNEEMIIDSVTGKTLNETNIVNYVVNYNSNLENPSIRVRMSRRLYNQVYTSSYEIVDIKDYITDNLQSASGANTYLLINNPSSEQNVVFHFKPELVTGTYKLEFILCDGNSPIGTVEKYIIIR